MWIITLYIGAVLFSCAQSALTKQNSRCGGEVSSFNLCKAISFFAVLLLIFAFDRAWNLPTLLYGAGYGVLLCISMLAGYYALKTGPMALTSMIVTFSLLIPYGYGVVFLREVPGVPQIIGILLFFVSLFLIKAPSGEKNAAAPAVPERKTSGRWALYVALTLLANGVASIVQKQHQVVYPGEYTASFMAAAGLVTCVLFALGRLAVVRRTGTLVAQKTSQRAHSLLLGMLSGAANGLYGLAQLVLAATEDASILYPVLSAGTMLAVFVTGRVFFREKMTALQTAGFLVGLAAIVLLKL